jgi:hypothetical protein
MPNKSAPTTTTVVFVREVEVFEFANGETTPGKGATRRGRIMH